MTLDRVTRAKINSLLHEIRSWPEKRPPCDATALGRRFQLDPLIVLRVAQAEGIDLDLPGHTDDVDPNQATAVMATDELVEALRSSG